MIEQQPLEVCVQGCSAETVIHDVLDQAERRGHAEDLAQCLVGAKLEMRFNREVLAWPHSRSDSNFRSNGVTKPGHFEVGNAVIEVVMGLPDCDHIEHIGKALGNLDAEVWILTRDDHVMTWKNAVEKVCGPHSERVIVTTVERFVGQTITELAGFSTKRKVAQLESLFAQHNNRAEQAGTPGIRIVLAPQ